MEVPEDEEIVGTDGGALKNGKAENKTFQNKNRNDMMEEAKLEGK